MKNLIRDIQNRLESEIAELAYVDINWGQLSKSDDLPVSVNFPAALIDIVKAEYSNEGKFRQIGIIEIGISVIDNSDFGSKNVQDNFFDILRNINKALHGQFNSAYYGPLNKISMEHIKREDELQEYLLKFRVQLIDTSAERKTLKTSATIGEINPEFLKMQVS